MTMPSFKQVESNYGKKEPCQQHRWIIKFYLCLNFGYRKYDIIFSVRTLNGCTRCTQELKNLRREQLLILSEEELISF